jgi:UDP-N-acetylmuramoyl-tripeptide--D-alanyl-D-alanine ligase
MAWSREEVLAATGGRLLRQGRTESFGEIVTDSGKVRRGSIFLALKGERLDGHRFVAEAVKRGAACVIVHRQVGSRATGRVAVVRVPDTLAALGDLAHYRRQKLRPTVIAITGSNGKTTTKEMLAAVLVEASLKGEALHGKVLKTEGNFNNLVGLPLTLLRLRPKHRIAVVELGTNHPGEIERLAQIADPDLGIITSVAAAHLEGLNSLAGVAREKGALYRTIRAGGAVAVNLDDPWVRRLGDKFKGRKITYGTGGEVCTESLRSAGPRGVRFTLRIGNRRCNVRLGYLGEHNIANAAGAAALAYGLGVSPGAIRRGLEKARPYAMRMQIQGWNGVGIINDAYNANPASMKSAVKTLAHLACSGKRIAVLGDMFELGKRSGREHRELGREVARAGLDALYLLGREAREVQKGAVLAGMPAAAVFAAADHAALAELLRDRIKRGDWLLVKGSRGMKMEKVIEALKGGQSE